MVVCPTAVIDAPAERIWHLLTDSGELARWTRTKLIDGPRCITTAGDRLVLRAGMFPIVFDVGRLEPPQQFNVDIELPFGIRNSERIAVTPIDASSCRVTFN